MIFFLLTKFYQHMQFSFHNVKHIYAFEQKLYKFGNVFA